MVRGYHIYKAIIWASVVGEEFREVMNCHLAAGILANHCCSVNLAYFSVLHFPQSCYCHRLKACVDGSTGLWKAIRRLEDCPFTI